MEPVSGQVLPTNSHSRTKILFKCGCGNHKLIIWKNFTTNHTKSCGSCKSHTKYNIDEIKANKFEHLQLCLDQDLTNINSNSKLWFQCDCGRKKQIALKSVEIGRAHV